MIALDGPGSEDDTQPESPTQPGPEPEPDSDAESGAGRLSYRQRKEHSEALARLAAAIVELAPHQLAELPIDAELRGVVEVCRTLTRSPKIRELRRISTILRRHDYDTLAAAVGDAGKRGSNLARRLRECESWRTKILDGDDTVLDAFVTQYERGDRQRLRQLARQARRTPTSRASKSLFQAIREAVEASAPSTD